MSDPSADVTGRFPRAGSHDTDPASPSTASSPRDLVDALDRWARDTPWVDWLELAGSLGRGGGDALSDVDAGLGLGAGDGVAERGEQVLAAVLAFAPVAASHVQRWGERAAHLIVMYRDGGQLSLVVSPGEARPGLPPQAVALLDRSGRLADDLPKERWDPDGETVREWAFLAWVAVGDAARHAHRGHPWRALRSLTEAREEVWKLWADRLDLVFPQFGAVTVENADAEPPPGVTDTHPATLEPDALLAAAAAMARVLRGVGAPAPDGLAAVVEARLALLSRTRPLKG